MGLDKEKPNVLRVTARPRDWQPSYLYVDALTDSHPSRSYSRCISHPFERFGRTWRYMPHADPTPSVHNRGSRRSNSSNKVAHHSSGSGLASIGLALLTDLKAMVGRSSDKIAERTYNAALEREMHSKPYHSTCGGRLPYSL